MKIDATKENPICPICKRRMDLVNLEQARDPYNYPFLPIWKCGNEECSKTQNPEKLKYLPTDLYITFHNELIEELIVEIKVKPNGESAYTKNVEIRKKRKNLLELLTILNALNLLKESD